MIQLNSPYLDRVCQVAKAGNHSILVVTSDPAFVFFQLVKKHGKIRLKARKPCPCGNLFNEKVACICNNEDIVNYQKNLPFTDMAIKYEPDWQDLILDIKLNKKSLNFLKTAYDKLGLKPSDLQKTLNITKSIAKLEKSEDIEITHIAEALNYIKIREM